MTTNTKTRIAKVVVTFEVYGHDDDVVDALRHVPIDLGGVSKCHGTYGAKRIAVSEPMWANDSPPKRKRRKSNA